MVVLSLSIGDALGAAQIFQLHAFQLDAGFFEDRLAAGQDGDVFQHGFAAIAEARSLHGAGVQRATQLVDNQSGERFAFHFFRDDQQRTAGARNLLEHGSRSFMLLIFFSWIRMYGIFENALPCGPHRSRSRARDSRGRTACLPRSAVRSPWSSILRP